MIKKPLPKGGGIFPFPESGCRVLISNNEVIMDMFNPPIRSKKVRDGVVAYVYSNGTINIAGQKYIGWSLTDAIKLFRKKFPCR